MQDKQLTVICDSSCNFMDSEVNARLAELGLGDIIAYESVPLSIICDGIDTVDDASLDLQALLDYSKKAKHTGTSCPSVGSFVSAFQSAPSKDVICVTISANVSGSYQAAVTARDIALSSDPTRRIIVIDSASAGAQVEYAIDRVFLCDGNGDGNIPMSLMGAAGRNELLEVASSRLTDTLAHSSVLYRLSSFGNLVKGGRLPLIVGTLASGLNIRIIGGVEDGRLTMVSKAKGDKRAVREIYRLMAEDRWDEQRLFIDYVGDDGRKIADMIASGCACASVKIRPCRGLCSYYAEDGGVIVGFGTRR